MRTADGLELTAIFFFGLDTLLLESTLLFSTFEQLLLHSASFCCCCFDSC